MGPVTLQDTNVRVLNWYSRGGHSHVDLGMRSRWVVAAVSHLPGKDHRSASFNASDWDGFVSDCQLLASNARAAASHPTCMSVRRSL
jgi:hypothetical protein